MFSGHSLPFIWPGFDPIDLGICVDSVSGVLFYNLVLTRVLIRATADQVLVIVSLRAQFLRTVCFNGSLVIFPGFFLVLVNSSTRGYHA